MPQNSGSNRRGVKMEEWSGFTDEELGKIDRGRGSASKSRGGTRSQFNKPRTGKPVKSLRNTGSRELPPQNTQLQPNQMLSKPPPKSDKRQPQNEILSRKEPSNNNLDETKQTSELCVKDTCNVNQESGEAKEVKPEVVIKEVDAQEYIKKQMGNVEQFQMQQKLIEEQNKKKKQMLADAIKRRQRKAKAETSKLIEMQNELVVLDQKLSVDVSIIRNRIEEQSRIYLDAQKRYEKAELEFIEAKMGLHSASEMKEQLTEHLYTIIHQNELRKAKRLAELMERLEVEGLEEIEDIKVELTMPPQMIQEDYVANSLSHPHHVTHVLAGSSTNMNHSVTTSRQDSTMATSTDSTSPVTESCTAVTNTTTCSSDTHPTTSSTNCSLSSSTSPTQVMSTPSSSVVPSIISSSTVQPSDKVILTEQIEISNNVNAHDSIKDNIQQPPNSAIIVDKDIGNPSQSNIGNPSQSNIGNPSQTNIGEDDSLTESKSRT